MSDIRNGVVEIRFTPGDEGNWKAGAAVAGVSGAAGDTLAWSFDFTWTTEVWVESSEQLFFCP